MTKLNLLAGCASVALIVAAMSGTASADIVKVEGATGQTAVNHSSVSNSAFISSGHISGKGASVGASAVGAQSAFAGSFINEVTHVDVNGPITQKAVQAGSDHYGYEVYNNSTIIVGDISGNGASAQVSAAGAVSAVSVSYVNSRGDADFGNITQEAYNLRSNDVKVNGSVYANKYISYYDNNKIDISGNGASISVSSLGAASSTSVSRVGPYSYAHDDDVRAGRVTQTTVNTGRVKTKNSTYGSIKLGNISGNGSSASVSATGAASSVGVSSINNSWSNGNSINIGSINQTTKNYGSSVTNQGGSISVGNISGKGSSASISATGAASQVSVSSINDTSVASATLSSVGQTTVNYATVSNTGAIGAGSISGNGASVSIGATGAASVVSVSATN